MINATQLKAHRTAASLSKGGCFQTYRTHAGRPEAPRGLRWQGPTVGLVAQPRSVERLQGRGTDVRCFPEARAMISEKGYDGDWLRQALTQRGTTPCIPSKSNRKVLIPHGAMLHRQRHLFESMFGYSRAGGASTRAMIAVSTPCSRPSPSPDPSSSGLVRNRSRA